MKSVRVNPKQAIFTEFASSDQGEWIRVITDSDTKATIHFSYSDNDNRSDRKSVV